MKMKIKAHCTEHPVSIFLLYNMSSLFFAFFNLTMEYLYKSANVYGSV